jgi:hypothetical protein
MGGGVSSATKIKSYEDKKVQSRSIQDEAVSVRSKSSAIKLLMRQESSRGFFQDYIHKHKDNLNFSSYMNYYLDIDRLNIIKDEKIKRNAIQELISKYSSLQGPFLSMHDDLRNDLNMPISNKSQIDMIIIQAKEEALIKLNPIFDEFVNSESYKEWQKSENKREINFRSIHSSNRIGSPDDIAMPENTNKT